MNSLKIIIPVFILFLSSFHFAFADEEMGSIELDLHYPSGDNANAYGVTIKVVQDNEVLYSEFSEIQHFPFVIDSLPLNHEYEIEVFVNSMHIKSAKIKLNNNEQ